jgi:hypothetical protein
MICRCYNARGAEELKGDSVEDRFNQEMKV